MNINYNESFEQMKNAGALAAKTLDEITSAYFPDDNNSKLRENLKKL